MVLGRFKVESKDTSVVSDCFFESRSSKDNPTISIIHLYVHNLLSSESFPLFALDFKDTSVLKPPHIINSFSLILKKGRIHNPKAYPLSQVIVSTTFSINQADSANKNSNHKDIQPQLRNVLHPSWRRQMHQLWRQVHHQQRPLPPLRQRAALQGALERAHGPRHARVLRRLSETPRFASYVMGPGRPGLPRVERA